MDERQAVSQGFAAALGLGADDWPLHALLARLGVSLDAALSEQLERQAAYQYLLRLEPCAQTNQQYFLLDGDEPLSRCLQDRTIFEYPTVWVAPLLCSHFVLANPSLFSCQPTINQS